MITSESLKLLSGIFTVTAGMLLFKYIYKQTKQGYKSEFGNDIKLYFAAGGAITLSMSLIYNSLYN
jgi:hypothetical protein